LRTRAPAVFTVAVVMLVVAGCGSGSNSKATSTAGTTGSKATNTSDSSSSGKAPTSKAVATSRSKHHVGDTITAQFDGNAVQAQLVKVFDTVTNPTFWTVGGNSMPSDLTSSTHYVGVQFIFTNTSSNPEALGKEQPDQPLDPTFGVTGQLSAGGADESSNHYVLTFDGCAPTDQSGTLAPGANVTYCAVFNVPNDAQVVEVDWNGIDTTNTPAVWSVP
jgi:hypothetical protein